MFSIAPPAPGWLDNLGPAMVVLVPKFYPKQLSCRKSCFCANRVENCSCQSSFVIALICSSGSQLWSLLWPRGAKTCRCTVLAQPLPMGIPSRGIAGGFQPLECGLTGSLEAHDASPPAPSAHRIPSLVWEATSRWRLSADLELMKPFIFSICSSFAPKTLLHISVHMQLTHSIIKM